MQKIELPDNYTPSLEEEYMNPKQLEYFRRKLLRWKMELIAGSNKTLNRLETDNTSVPDMTDQANTEAERAFALRTSERSRKLIDKIDEALYRIKEGTYGYCETTGEQIGINRLEARPIATLSIEAQRRHENYENTHIDEDYRDTTSTKAHLHW